VKDERYQTTVVVAASVRTVHKMTRSHGYGLVLLQRDNCAGDTCCTLPGLSAMCYCLFESI